MCLRLEKSLMNYLSLVEFADDNRYHYSINMTPYEALFRNLIDRPCIGLR